MQSERNNLTSIHVDDVQYTIDLETAAALKNGVVPEKLRQQIGEKQGQDICYEYCRQCRLIKKAMDQIKCGELPESLRPLILSGNVSAEILLKLTEHKLVGKAEKLYRRKLISLETLNAVRREYLTADILPALKQAFLTDTAIYLYREKEISAEILTKVKAGEIDNKFILTIRRSHRHLCHLCEQELEHSIYEHPDGCSTADKLTDAAGEPETRFAAMMIHWYLEEAFKWLTPEDHSLIRNIFYDEIPMVRIADRLGVSEGTIRHRKKRALKQLRTILVDVLDFPYEYWY